LLDALMTQAFAALRASPGARAYYDRQAARGAGHNAALRQLANRLVGILRADRCHGRSCAYRRGEAGRRHLMMKRVRWAVLVVAAAASVVATATGRRSPRISPVGRRQFGQTGPSGG
jgi:predicted anti-sigma-YlaC factor YlaD